MKLHYLIGRLSSPFQLLVFFIYNRIFHVPRARVLVWNESGELLLVRNWAGRPEWGLPGGGVERGERLDAAAKRELYEETGMMLPLEDFMYVTTINYQYEAPIYMVTISQSVLPSKPHNPWEITAMQWFSPGNLPTDLSPLVMLALKDLPKSR